MTNSRLPEVAPHWLTVKSFLRDRINQPIDIGIQNGGVLKYQILGQIGRLSFEFPGDRIPAILTRWPAVRIQESQGSINVVTSGASEDGGLEGVHAIVESALRINKEKAEPFADSLVTALRQYRKLVAVQGLNQQVLLGLLGELIVFDEMTTLAGFDRSISAWHTREDSIHDFDMGTWDLEVKTTGRSNRIHRISSLAQMTPTDGRRLFLISIHLLEAGLNEDATYSLPSVFQEISEKLRNYSSVLHDAFIDRVDRVLEKADLDTEALAKLELPRYRLRASNRLIEVNARCPRITRDIIESDDDMKARISGVEYDIDCEGLGTDEFVLTGTTDEV